MYTFSPACPGLILLLLQLLDASLVLPDQAAKDLLLSLDSADDPPEETGSVTGYTIISCPVLGLNGWYLYTTDNGYLIFEIGSAEHCYYVGSDNAGKLSGYFRT